MVGVQLLSVPGVSSILEIAVCMLFPRVKSFWQCYLIVEPDNHLILYLQKHLFSNFAHCSRRTGSYVNTWSVSEISRDVGVQGAPRGVSCQLRHPGQACRGCGGGSGLRGESCWARGCPMPCLGT